MTDRYPFAFNPSQSFVQQASDFIADVFYEILPEVGFEVRDEQIYMAFQLERAYADKQSIFAEAGVGTGKTLVYLLYAICYARYTQKPAVIACADESLIEQLVKPEGDIAKLAKHLNLLIDARLGKSPESYLCLKKLDESKNKDEDAALFQTVHDELPGFVHSRTALQKFHAYGDRKQYPHLNDEQWNKISWDAFQDCFVCDKRHRCGQTLSREYYRQSEDLIICSHDFYMKHVWTYEGRKREGQLPLLPDHSSVVFDEGHLLETAAQKALTYKLNHAVFEEIVLRLLKGEVRESLAVAVDEAILQSEVLFELLAEQSSVVLGSDRKEILYNDDLLREVNRLKDVISEIEEELVFEAGLFTLEPYQLRIAEEHLEMMQIAFVLVQKQDQLISWTIEDNMGLTLVIMPRLVREVLLERVFSQKMPIVFSSATISIDKSFHYVADSLGVNHYLSFSVPSPYDYKEQMKVMVPKLAFEDTFKEKMQITSSWLEKAEGGALILFPSREEMNQFRKEMDSNPNRVTKRILFEGDQEISHIISAFQTDVDSILCAVTLWEGLDVPGPSLSNVIIWSLPFPPNDPVFSAKRKAAVSPFEEVDLPYMLLRLKQGMGRLIRSSEDRGQVLILGVEMHHHERITERVKDILPEGVEFV